MILFGIKRCELKIASDGVVRIWAGGKVVSLWPFLLFDLFSASAIYARLCDYEPFESNAQFGGTASFWIHRLCVVSRVSVVYSDWVSSVSSAGRELSVTNPRWLTKMDLAPQ